MEDLEGPELSSQPWTAMGLASSVIPGLSDEQDNECDCGLSYSQRIMGFIFCFALGCCASVLATMNVPLIMIAPKKFALPYTFGNLLSFASTSFLVGPMRQVRTMFDPVRKVASILYLLSIGGTLFFAMYWQWYLGTMVAVSVQFLSFVWYCASYVPFGRSVLAAGCKKCWNRSST
mmetsp:Transcript_25780/g.50788  ORF Transcript_25780/g.50788 Transcript_25780/m.50788 type:complete len:176 (-) Transcript_25780:241-768(-)